MSDYTLLATKNPVVNSIFWPIIFLSMISFLGLSFLVHLILMAANFSLLTENSPAAQLTSIFGFIVLLIATVAVMFIFYGLQVVNRIKTRYTHHISRCEV